MYLRRCGKTRSGAEQKHWQLVESVRTERGPRQRVVAYLGSMDEPAREGIRLGALDKTGVLQRQLFDEDLEPEWAVIDTKRVRVERSRDFGGSWLALKILDILGLSELFEAAIPSGREDVPWSIMALVLIVCRLCYPSSELRISECLYERSALEDLLGLPADKINDDRLYRALDRLLPHKEALERHLKEKIGTLFNLEYDLMLYDVTSTYIEGIGADNEQMLHGYSRDQRADCRQVCIALVVSRCGLPLGYEVFDGNRADVSTVEEIVTKIEKQYGVADRIWVMDRGMVSQKNIDFLQQGGRRYILGASRSLLKQYERALLDGQWTAIKDGLDVQLCPASAMRPRQQDPQGQSEPGLEEQSTPAETFVLCRSRDRKAKEKAMIEKFEARIEEGLVKIAESCAKANTQQQGARQKGRKPGVSELERRIGALLSKNSRARRLFKVVVHPPDAKSADGPVVTWEKDEQKRAWCELSEGCYLLRTNISDWKPEDLWSAYIQLTEAESAFQIQKNDLKLRPIWHQTAERTKAHILICFLAYAAWKTFGQICKAAGLGDEPRQVFEEIAQIRMADVIMRTTTGVDIRRRCIIEPSKAQKVLLDRLHLRLPKQLRILEM